jgi:hypothetical protein
VTWATAPAVFAWPFGDSGGQTMPPRITIGIWLIARVRLSIFSLTVKAKKLCSLVCSHDSHAWCEQHVLRTTNVPLSVIML